MLNGWRHPSDIPRWKLKLSPHDLRGIALPSWAPNSRHGFGHEILCLRSLVGHPLVVPYGTPKKGCYNQPQLLPLAPWHPALQAWQGTLATMIMDMNDQKDDYHLAI